MGAKFGSAKDTLPAEPGAPNRESSLSERYISTRTVEKKVPIDRWSKQGIPRYSLIGDR